MNMDDACQTCTDAFECVDLHMDEATRYARAEQALKACTDAFGRLVLDRVGDHEAAPMLWVGYIDQGGGVTAQGAAKLAELGPRLDQVRAGSTLVFFTGGQRYMGIVVRTTARAVFVEGAKGRLHRITAAHWWRARVQESRIPAELVRDLPYFYGHHV